MLHNPAQLIRWRFSIQLSSFVGTLRPMGRKPSAKRLAIGHVVAKTEQPVEANHLLDAGKHVGRRKSESDEKKLRDQIQKCLRDNFSTLSEEEHRAFVPSAAEVRACRNRR